MPETPYKPAGDEETKIGVYICHCGGNISDHVDVEKVAEAVRNIPGVEVSQTNMFMCSDPGQELIQEDIKKSGINRVVVASCAPALHELTFRCAISRAQMNPFLYEHANIREQDSWVHHGDAATAKAITLVAAAIAKARNLEPLEPIRVNAENHATIIGGGIAGLRAAVDLGKRGIKVALIEKSPFLGGNVGLLDKVFPTDEKAGDLIQYLADAAVKDPNITIYTCAEITGFEGYIGNFKIRISRRKPQDEGAENIRAILKNAHPGSYHPFAGYLPDSVPTSPEETELTTGVIIFATGFTIYQPKQDEFGYGSNKEVITLRELIRLMADNQGNGSTLTLKGRKIRRVAMIHCVGSRQIPGIHEADANDYMNEYCSRTCCTATLQAALEIREQYPDTQVLDFYRDIRTYGHNQEGYYDRAAAKNVLFFRYQPEDSPIITRSSGEFPLKISVRDTLTFNEEVEAGVDLVVLATGMQAANINNLVEMMKLPVGADKFLQEVHPKLRPVEMANGGILLAGTCQAPMDINEACNAAQAAAAKAAALLGKGYVELDPFVAKVNNGKCRGNGQCITECPEEAIHRGDDNRAEVNPAMCTGCGMCVAVCPENAIDVQGWTLKQYEDMVDAIIQF
ncbi:MAG: CoB--CoM heterodisulfide reductase iron-sulfur subunit A family protein [Pseudomonadota bacterium]